MCGSKKAFEAVQNRLGMLAEECEMLVLGFVELAFGLGSPIFLGAGNKPGLRASHLTMAIQSNAAQKEHQRCGTDSHGALH